MIVMEGDSMHNMIIGKREIAKTHVRRAKLSDPGYDPGDLDRDNPWRCKRSILERERLARIRGCHAYDVPQ